MIYANNEYGEVVRIRLSQVSQIRMENRSFVFDTPTGTYHGINTLQASAEYLKNYGYVLLNKNNLVNISHIESYDKKTKKVILRGGIEVKVSRQHQKWIASLQIDK